MNPVRPVLKLTADATAQMFVLPAALCCWLEGKIAGLGEAVFQFWAQAAACLPGLPGVYLRRAFYRLTLRECSTSFYIGFGSVLTHRQVEIERDVYIGAYALIGCARLRQGALIGSRVSILSGPRLHEYADGGWRAADRERMCQIEIGDHCWIGEGAIVMADVGAGAMIAAGSVTSTPVPQAVMVAGNPARFVRRLVSATPKEEHVGSASGGGPPLRAVR